MKRNNRAYIAELLNDLQVVVVPAIQRTCPDGAMMITNVKTQIERLLPPTVPLSPWGELSVQVRKLPTAKRDGIIALVRDELRFYAAEDKLAEMSAAVIVTDELWSEIVAILGPMNRHLVRLRYLAEQKGLKT